MDPATTAKSGQREPVVVSRKISWSRRLDSILMASGGEAAAGLCNSVSGSREKSGVLLGFRPDM
ncbi:MAG: hypothetical protein ACLTXL_07060 [Clostridia bacterium]